MNTPQHNTPALLNLALTWSQNQAVTMATVIETWGSAPRPRGSVMLIREDGLFEGSVSGGCIEGAVIVAASTVIKTGQAQILEFGVSNDDAIKVGLACGGTIKIFIERLEPLHFEHIKIILATLSDVRPIIWVKPLDQSAPHLITKNDIMADEFHKLIVADQSKIIDFEECESFALTLNPPLAMVIIGAVHIAQALDKLAKHVGFKVHIIDPRAAFAEAERMQDCEVSIDWPDEILAANPPTARTAVITLTHDPKLDDAALKIALNSPAFYIGCLGSKKTHAKRLERLGQMGFDAKTCARIHGPVGLDIGAQSPSEIAVSILAQIIATYRGAKDGNA